MARYVLEPTTSAANSHPFIVNKSRGIPAQVTAPGLTGDETVTIQKQAINKEVNEGWANYYLDGEAQQITVDHSGITIYGPGTYRGTKTTTASAVGIEVSTDIDP